MNSRDSNIVYDLLDVMDNIMKLDPKIRDRALALLQKHFDNFQRELKALGREGKPEAEAEAKPMGPGRAKSGRRAGKGGWPEGYRLTREDIAKDLLFDELFSRPLSERDDEDGF